MAISPVIVVQRGTTFNVSTITTLNAALDIKRYRQILVSLQNPDLTNEVTLMVDPGTASGQFDTNRRQTVTASPGEEAHVEIFEPLYPNIRILAQTTSPTFPVVNNVTYEVRVECLTNGIQDQVLRTVAGSSIP